MYFFKCKITHFDINRYVSFNVTHGRPTTRHSSDPLCYLFLGLKLNHTIFFQRIVPIWNQLLLVATSDTSLLSFKS